MSHDEMRRYFETVLTIPPRDRTDIDAAIATAQRRQRRRGSFYVGGGVACVLIVGALAFTTWHGNSNTNDFATSPTPSVSWSESGATRLTASGVSVTAPAQLFGMWRTVALDGVAVTDQDNLGNGPLVVRFQQHGAEFWWSANDTCNDRFGTFTAADGRFSAAGSGTTLVGCAPQPVRERNASVVNEADEALIAPATGSEPRRLYLLHSGAVIGAYAYQPTGRVHGTFELVGGPATGDGKTPHTPAAIEDLELRNDKGTVVSANTDGHGVFDIEAPAGDYTLVTARGCPAPVTVHITDQKTTKITLTCPVR